MEVWCLQPDASFPPCTLCLLCWLGTVRFSEPEGRMLRVLEKPPKLHLRPFLPRALEPKSLPSHSWRPESQEMHNVARE